MLKNLKVSSKLIIGFVLAVLVSSAAGITALTLLRTSDAQYSKAMESYGFVQGEVGRLDANFQSHRATLRNIFLNAGNLEEMNAQEAILQTELDAVTKDMATVEAKLDPQFLDDLEAIKVDMASYEVIRNRLLAIVETDPAQAIIILNTEASPVANKIGAAIDALLNDVSAAGNIISDQLTKQTELFTWVILGIMAGAFVLSFIVATVITKGLVRPIREMVGASQKMAEGDLSSKVTYQSKDEIGQLASSFDLAMGRIHSYLDDLARCLGEMANGNFDVHTNVEYKGDFILIEKSMNEIATSLSDTLHSINDAAEQVSSGSDQVSSGAQALSQGTTEQASSVEELAATISEISSQIRGNAENSAQASSKVDAVGAEILQSNDKMQELISAMQDINRSSEEIGKIIKTIEDIAFQTNILALNAAVEAARAGAAGKGFAVVADEVRNLASKSAEASKNTSALIESSIQSVQRGGRIVDETAVSLSHVVDGSKEVMATIEQISAASNEQASAATQVTLGIDQISSVVQTNSATSQQSAAAAEELSSQAQMLKDLVSHFRLKGYQYSSTPAPKHSSHNTPARELDFSGSSKY